MLDWRILGASFVALLVVSSMFVGSFGIGDFFSNLVNQIGGWLQGSPFGGFFSAPPAAATKHINIILYPANLELEPDEPINMTTGETKLTGFSGKLSINFVSKELKLLEKDSQLQISLFLTNASLSGLQLTSLSLEGLRFDIQDMKAENGTIEILNFIGDGTLKTDRLELSGNVSRVNARIGEMLWELK